MQIEQTDRQIDRWEDGWMGNKGRWMIEKQISTQFSTYIAIETYADR